MEEEQLQVLMNELLMNANEFSKTIGVSVDSIYHILKKRNKMSASVKRKIFETYPNLNKEWFETGAGEMYTWKSSDKNLNVLKESKTTYGCKLCEEKERYIHSLLERIEEQKEQIETQKNCIEALRALGGGKGRASSG